MTMFLAEYIYSICTCYIVSRVVTRETISESIRVFFDRECWIRAYELFSCFFCFSFWCSLVLAAYYQQNLFVIIVGANALNILLREK